MSGLQLGLSIPDSNFTKNGVGVIQDFKFHKKIMVRYTRFQISQRNLGLGMGLGLGLG